MFAQGHPGQMWELSKARAAWPSLLAARDLSDPDMVQECQGIMSFLSWETLCKTDTAYESQCFQRLISFLFSDSAKRTMLEDSRLEEANHQAEIWGEDEGRSKSTWLVKSWQVTQCTHEAIANQRFTGQPDSRPVKKNFFLMRNPWVRLDARKQLLKSHDMATVGDAH